MILPGMQALPHIFERKRDTFAPQIPFTTAMGAQSLLTRSRGMWCPETRKSLPMRAAKNTPPKEYEQPACMQRGF